MIRPPTVRVRPLDAALAYADRGWAVFPLHGIIAGRCSCRNLDCPHPAKHPVVRHGLHDATTHPQRIRSWWDRWPWANLGVATGRRSNFVVIDIDPPNGGTRSLERLQFLMGSLPRTLTARTGGGGLHLYYCHPDGELRNTAGHLPGVSAPLPGLDLRADGGYVVAPPSRHASAAAYDWEDEHVPVVAAPSWLQPQPRAHSPMGSRIQSLPRWGGSNYGLAALRGEAEAVRHSPVGSRNHRLNRAAFSLGMLVAGGELERCLVEDALLAAALDAGLPEAETRATIRSGLRAGAGEPRRRPEAQPTTLPPSGRPHPEEDHHG